MAMTMKNRVVPGACALLLLLSACSSAPKPTSELILTEAALQNAEASGAKEYAPIELRTAQEQKAQADAHMKNGDFVKARRAADASLANAELAKAKADLAKSRTAVDESREGLELMETELQRIKSVQ